MYTESVERYVTLNNEDLDRLAHLNEAVCGLFELVQIATGGGGSELEGVFGILRPIRDMSQSLYSNLEDRSKEPSKLEGGVA